VAPVEGDENIRLGLDGAGQNVGVFLMGDLRPFGLFGFGRRIGQGQAERADGADEPGPEGPTEKVDDVVFGFVHDSAGGQELDLPLGGDLEYAGASAFRGIGGRDQDASIEEDALGKGHQMRSESMNSSSCFLV